jgi:hypothetical protein
VSIQSVVPERWRMEMLVMGDFVERRRVVGVVLVMRW